MGLSIIYSELQELLTNYPSDIRESIVSYLEEISSDLNDTRNILGMFEHDATSDGIADKLAEELIQDMTKRIKVFNKDMLEMIIKTELDYLTKIKKGR